MKRIEPLRISEILDGLKRTPEMSQKLREAEALAAWADVVGPKCSAAAIAVRVTRRALCLQCASSALRQEITMRKPEIIMALNATAGHDTITDIRFI